MPTIMKIIYQGKEYVSKPTNDLTPEAMRDAVYEQIDNFSKFTIETDKGFMVFGKEVVQGAIFLMEEITAR
jgi:hypothetical protein